MEQSRILRHLLLALPLIVIAALCGHLIGSLRHAYSQSATSNKTSAPPQQLSAEGQASLHAIIQAENLPELRWPNFSDYDKQVQKFYEMYGYSLPWVRGMEPTEEARQIIAVLFQAEQKGLTAEDYDGNRVGQLGWQSSNQPRRNRLKRTPCSSTPHLPSA